MYTGHEWHYRARMYDANLGRFTSRDPIGYQSGANLNAPYISLQYTDPSGLFVGCGCKCNITVGAESPKTLSNPAPQKVPVEYLDWWTGEWTPILPNRVSPDGKTTMKGPYTVRRMPVSCNYLSTVPVTVLCTSSCFCGAPKNGPVRSFAFTFIRDYRGEYLPNPGLFSSNGPAFGGTVTCPAAPPGRGAGRGATTLDESTVTTANGTFILTAAIPSMVTISSDKWIVPVDEPQ